MAIIGGPLIVGALLLTLIGFSVDTGWQSEPCRAVITLSTQGERFPAMCDRSRTARVAWPTGLAIPGAALLTLTVAPTVLRRIEESR